jgi:hypothetical protein
MLEEHRQWECANVEIVNEEEWGGREANREGEEHPKIINSSILEVVQQPEEEWVDTWERADPIKVQC